MRHKRIAIAAALLASVVATPVAAYEEWAEIEVWNAAARHGVNAHALVATLRCESINFNYNVIVGYRLGAAGEQGMAQLHPRGLLPMFYSWGYTNPYSAWQAADFTALAFKYGYAWHWSCYRVYVRGW